jgi:hypothetical protein
VGEFVAEHPFISASEAMRPSFSNTGQSSRVPGELMQVDTARESTLLSQPFMNSPYIP